MKSKLNPKEKIIVKYLENNNFLFDRQQLIDQLKRKQDRVVLILKDNTNSKFVFKYLVNQSRVSRKKFLREIAVLKMLAQSRAISVIKTNKILTCGSLSSTQSVNYVIHDFIEGKVTGSIFEFDTNCLDNEFTNLLIDCITLIRTINLTASQQDIPSRIMSWVKKSIDESKRSASLKHYTDRLEKIFETNKCYLSDRSNYVFSHGDLTPLNIISGKDYFGIIDWELCGFLPKTFDCAYLFQRSWRHKKWQEALRETIFLKLLAPTDKSNFDFILIILTTLDIMTFEKTLSGKYIFKHKQHFSHQYLNNLLSFYLKKLDVLLDEDK